MVVVVGMDAFVTAGVPAPGTGHDRPAMRVWIHACCSWENSWGVSVWPSWEGMKQQGVSLTVDQTGIY